MMTKLTARDCLALLQQPPLPHPKGICPCGLQAGEAPGAVDIRASSQDAGRMLQGSGTPSLCVPRWVEAVGEGAPGGGGGEQG